MRAVVRWLVPCVSGDSRALLVRHLFRIQFIELRPGHVLCQAHGLEANADRMLYHLLEVVFCVARAELARVGVHCERHFGRLSC